MSPLVGSVPTTAQLVVVQADPCTTRERIPHKSVSTSPPTVGAHITAHHLESPDSACLIGIRTHIKPVCTLLLVGNVLTSARHAISKHDNF